MINTVLTCEIKELIGGTCKEKMHCYTDFELTISTKNEKGSHKK